MLRSTANALSRSRGPTAVGVYYQPVRAWRARSAFDACASALAQKMAPLVLLSQTESPRRSRVAGDSAHGRDSRQDQELSWKTTSAAAVAPDALRPILPI